MALEALIETHGYWVLALGCLLEGETVLMLAGFAAHRGYLDPAWVFAIGASAGFVGDQFYFYLGRRHGAAVLARWPAIERQSGRLERLLQRFHAAVVIGVRFAYGLRVAGPILIGAGALLWSAVFTAIGWVFGQAAEAMLGRIKHLEGWLMLGLVAGAVVWLVVRKHRSGSQR
jgi:membrane protein DedA with SNARE-associated domain